MGVTGLWHILQPCARPIKIETLNRKRLAVDASIWIYQFLKAVRDKEGNALRNSHVVGFFRRICKLLFLGIKPVFVFDGGAPALKRQTIMARKRRREGRRDDAVRTAGKLLAVQMQRRAEEEEVKRKEERDGHLEAEAEVPDEDLVYVEELQMNAQERQQNRKFRKKDAYHLPDLEVSMSEMGGPDDPRVMGLEELEAYARQFDTGEDINVYDFSKIDYDSPFFMSLPASDRYNILNAARLRSRLRMGHSKEQLDAMFPDRMAFSKFQIERVSERNELTTRLMNINDGDAAYGSGSNRVAGEKAREYVLVKNDGVEGGWALGVLGGDEGSKQDKAIDIDEPVPVMKEESSEDDEVGFEDVPIEGLNRLPKRRKLDADAGDTFMKQRQALYRNRQRGAEGQPRQSVQPQDPDSLFVADQLAGADRDEWQEVDKNGELFGDEPTEEDEELRRAIAMSLEQGSSPPLPELDGRAQAGEDVDDDDMREVFHQRAAEEARPVPKGSARAIANILNKRANAAASDNQGGYSFSRPVLESDKAADEDDSVDLQAALTESRRGKRKVSPPQRGRPTTRQAPNKPATGGGFGGPLPFEKLDLGSSLLGKKKIRRYAEEAESAGGFEHPASIAQQKSEPLPPWFSGNVKEEIDKQRAVEREDRERAKHINGQFMFQNREAPALRRYQTCEVIDLEAEDEKLQQNKLHEVIDVDAGDDVNGMSVGHEVRMGDVAEAVRAEPPAAAQDNERGPLSLQHTRFDPFQVDESNGEQQPQLITEVRHSPSKPSEPATMEAHKHGDEQIHWSDSSYEGPDAAKAQEPAGGRRVSKASSQSSSPEFEDVPPATSENQASRSQSPDFEDINMSTKSLPPRVESPPPWLPDEDEDTGRTMVSGMAQQESMAERDEDFDDFSDPEDAELLKALTMEAEEHARFASTLNNKSTAQNIADYEKELKQLRNQQKKDRRDADEVTHIMITECQQLLRLFGLPYVTAPMEAEAQCAELVHLGLVDGIVTDDSDCFLFGGTRVYKNMFNQAKFVECYLASDLEKEFDLTRDKLVQVAQLLGSDYTEGLPGVGPVTALEILGGFPTLQDFKEWWTGVQMNTIPKEADRDHPFRKKFRRNATKLFLPATFPDPRVDLAYQNPEVDSDPVPFQWGVPDLDALRRFLMATIGWSQERTDEVLVPVIRDMNRRMDEGTQANITAFFEGGVGIGAAGGNSKGEAFAPRKRVEGSKRMGKALSRMAERAKVQRTLDPARGGDSEEDLQGIAMPDAHELAAAEDAAFVGRPVDKARTPKGRKQAEPVGSHEDDDEDGSEFEEPRKKNTKKAGGRRRKAVGHND